MSDLSALALPHIPPLHAYTPGLQPTEPGWIKLNTDENPYPPSPRAVAAVQVAICNDGDALRLYPDPRSGALRAAIAQSFGLTPDHVIVGNGSDDLLNLLMRVFAGPTDPAGFTFPSYSLYPVLVAIQDGAQRVIEFDRSMRLPVERIARSGAQAFFLTSPNAPTGVAFANAEIEAVLTDFPGVLVVDEAYAAFAAENAAPLVARHPRLVVVRTLSKSHALAGIRVGYALADPEVIGLLDRVRDSYNVNRLSQAAALAALGDTAYYERSISRIKATRDRWLAACRRRGWFTHPSQANFIFTEPRDARGETGIAVARSLDGFLRSRQILVRHFPGHALTAPFLRVSVGTDGDMIAVEQAIDAWLKPAK